MTIPADRTFVNEQRGIIDPWLKVVERHDNQLADLRTRMTAAEAPDPSDEAVNSFSSLSAFNEQVEADGGLIEATSPGDELSINVTGPGLFETDPNNRALNLALATYSAVIPGTGAQLAPIGLVSGNDKSATLNRMYVSPIVVPSRRAVTALNWKKTAIGGGDFAMSLYADGGCRPGAVLVVGGSTDYSGSPDTFSTTVSLTLNGGLYWIAFIANGSAPFRAYNSTAAALGLDSNFDPIFGWYRAVTFPDMLSDETGSTWTANTGDHPILTITC